ncbi:MAG TPA: hypothetical protein VFB84_05430 [Micromonosporaceae bacterium]|nr:hypothetical protein [Micromonosporaceae bacterium]
MDRASAVSRTRTAADPSQQATIRSSSARSTGVGGWGSTRQWCSTGNASHPPARTQPVVIRCAASSRQAPNPAEPTPYW